MPALKAELIGGNPIYTKHVFKGGGGAYTIDVLAGEVRPEGLNTFIVQSDAKDGKPASVAIAGGIYRLPVDQGRDAPVVGRKAMLQDFNSSPTITDHTQTSGKAFGIVVGLSDDGLTADVLHVANVE